MAPSVRERGPSRNDGPAASLRRMKRLGAGLLALALVACGGEGGDDAGQDAGGARDAGPADAGPPAGDAGLDAGASPDAASPIDAGDGDAAPPTDAGTPEDASAGDAGASDAGPSDAGAIDAGVSSGACEGADQRFCDTPADCAPVSCGCSCSGCGGFDYEEIVRTGCVADWYADHACAPPTICPLVCCPERTVTCVNHMCGVSDGATK